jgi:hypothetical protein
VNTPCSCVIIALHTPVTISTPRTISSTPPMMLTARMWRRRNVTERVAHPNPRVSRMNGMPRPSEYARPRRAARPGSPRFHDTERIAARVGPMHGVQPMPSAMPSSGAPIRPTLLCTCGCTVRWAKPKTPMKTRPRRMTTAPRIRVMASLYSRKNRPSVPPRIVTAMNTTVKPAMKRRTPSRRRDFEGDSTAIVAESALCRAAAPESSDEEGFSWPAARGRGCTAPPMNPR